MRQRQFLREHLSPFGLKGKQKWRAPGQRCASLLILALSAAVAQAQYPAPPIPVNTAKQVSPHVWAIMAFPNIAIVVGNRATLVVDTGLGTKNGAVVASEAKKLARGSLLYLTTTHYHPEHAGGDQGFPAATVIVRDARQEKDVHEAGDQMYERFRSMPQFAPFLEQEHTFRPADVLFDKEATLDLGGVRAQLLWLGGAHTNGDELIFVPEDSTLISGDVVQNKLAPHMMGSDCTAKGWISILDQLAPLNPRHIVPDHGELGDGSLIALEKKFLVDAETQTLVAKRQGKSADEAAQIVSDALKAQYSDWGNMNYVASTVKQIYAKD